MIKSCRLRAVPSSVLIAAKKCVRSLFAFWLIYVEDKNLSASRRRHKNWPLTGQPSRALRSTLTAPALRQWPIRVQLRGARCAASFFNWSSAFVYDLLYGSAETHSSDNFYC
ncbi:hypothetical protein T03_11565 [Trichinella britovi]|uniref:Uncharacterized protein n=3 Tax=Trichinella TaxID=6333 RepID=A0A0V1CQV0_TRIBR|nr:hypothetical protein T01_7784 [Trichinella spiralis]KRY51404.1 hypothetical protein T03_11565 [Trichinella britovi]